MNSRQEKLALREGKIASHTHFELHASPTELHPVDPKTSGMLKGRHGNLKEIREQLNVSSNFPSP